MTTVRDITAVLEDLAPLALAEDWDNVGLLVGARDWPVDGPVLLTIDLTDAVMDEAERLGAGMIVAYHPSIFGGLERLTADEPSARNVLRAARAGIAIYSPHTALDAAPGGMNDWLANGLGTGTISPLAAHGDLPPNEAFKVISFMPESALDAARTAMAAAGAGRIGDYETCSFELRGHGTFRGGDGTNPVVGARGALERVDEVRLEMVCGSHDLAATLAALRDAHPYEEPPIEVHALQPRPSATTGGGRLIELDAPVTRAALCDRVKAVLGAKHLKVGWADGAARTIRRVGLCVGAGGSFVDAAIARGACVFLTGEMRHHEVVSAKARGCSIVLAGHTNTERGYLRQVLLKRLKAALPVDVRVAKKDAAPLQVV